MMTKYRPTLTLSSLIYGSDFLKILLCLFEGLDEGKNN